MANWQSRSRQAVRDAFRTEDVGRRTGPRDLTAPVATSGPPQAAVGLPSCAARLSATGAPQVVSTRSPLSRVNTRMVFAGRVLPAECGMPCIGGPSATTAPASPSTCEFGK